MRQTTRSKTTCVQTYTVLESQALPILLTLDLRKYFPPLEGPRLPTLIPVLLHDSL